jgi:hypothetical protein
MQLTGCAGLLLALLAAPAMGQDRAIIDYDALFRDKAAEVVTSDEGGRTVETLMLPGEVMVRKADDRVVGMDQSEDGAVGCFFMIYVDLGASLQSCSVLGTSEERARYKDYMSRINTFVATNAYRPMTVEEVEGLVRTVQERADAPGCDRFDDEDMKGFIGTFVENFLSAEMGAVLDMSLATPRLPVNNPCL